MKPGPTTLQSQTFLFSKTLHNLLNMNDPTSSQISAPSNQTHSIGTSNSSRTFFTIVLFQEITMLSLLS